LKPYQEKMIREMELRNFAPSSKQLYLTCAKRVLEYFDREPELITSQEFENYILHVQNEGRLSSGTIYSYINIIRFIVNCALKRKEDPFEIRRRKREHRVPEILSKNELKRLFACADTVKKKTMLMTMYSTGVRIGELCRLEIKDIDFQRMLVHVRQGKGRKDRYTLLTNGLLDQLRIYYRKYRPTSYLFYGVTKDKPTDQVVPSKAFRFALRKSGIGKGKGSHTLRHCFATHLLEAGVDLRTIQVLMGHTSITTTVKYLKVTDKKLETAHVAVDLLKYC
jgi:integrase/recombinase XerD